MCYISAYHHSILRYAQCLFRWCLARYSLAMVFQASAIYIFHHPGKAILAEIQNKELKFNERVTCVADS